MSGSYHEYKSCTNKFIQWISSAATVIQRPSKSLPNTLCALRERTGIITESPNNIIALGDDLLGSFRDAMLAGFRSIQLRKYVHSLNLAVDTKNDDINHLRSNEGHLHCIKTLKGCYSNLHHWMKAQQMSDEASSPSTTSASQQHDHFNVYSLLSSLEEIEVEINDGDNSESEVDLSSALEDTVSIRSIDEIDEAVGDLKITTYCLLYDMMTASKQLLQVWEDVKGQRKSILTAVAAVMVAYRQICRSQALMQLKYPSMITAHDFFDCCVMETLSDEELKQIKKSSNFLFKLFCIKAYLEANTLLKGKNRPGSIIFRQKINDSDPPFIEIQFPFKPNDPSEYKRFIDSEYPRLYNNYFNCNERANQKRFHNQHLTKEFFDAFVPQFTTGTITVPQIFLTYCWIQSVTVLQDKEYKFSGTKFVLYARFVFPIGRNGE